MGNSYKAGNPSAKKSNTKSSGGKKPPKSPKRTVAVPSSSGGGFVKGYRHYRTGKWMWAPDYGYQGWPFGYGRRG
jgi:hypothetical protein